MLRKRLSVLVGAAVMVLSMFAVSAPAFAQDCVEEFPGAGSGACEQNPGGSQGSNSRHQTPPEDKPGVVQRSGEANEHDPNTLTGRGKRAEF